MRDGRFETLEAVVNFYSQYIQAHPNLDTKLKNEDGASKYINFIPTEKADLERDITHMDDLAFSDPFKL